MCYGLSRLPIDDQNKGSLVLELPHCRENLSCCLNLKFHTIQAKSFYKYFSTVWGRKSFYKYVSTVWRRENLWQQTESSNHNVKFVYQRIKKGFSLKSKACSRIRSSVKLKEKAENTKLKINLCDWVVRFIIFTWL